MAEILLDQPEVDPGFEQVGRVAVPEGVGRDPLFDAELLDQSSGFAVSSFVFCFSPGLPDIGALLVRGCGRRLLEILCFRVI